MATSNEDPPATSQQTPPPAAETAETAETGNPSTEVRFILHSKCPFIGPADLDGRIF